MSTGPALGEAGGAAAPGPTNQGALRSHLLQAYAAVNLAAAPLDRARSGVLFSFSYMKKTKICRECPTGPEVGLFFFC
jgi:hypothetical protein